MKRQPTLEEADQLWRELAAEPGPLRLEDAFEKVLRKRKLDHEYSLSAHLVGAYEQAERHDDVIALARAVLASGAEFPTNWTPSLAGALITTKRLDEAEPIVREVIGSLESYKADMLVVAMRYERARGNTADEELCYHAGKRWFTNFRYSKKRAATFGPKPKGMEAAWGRWLERWIATSHWNPSAAREIAHWLVWFDEIESPVIASYRGALAAERDRRNALYDQLRTARDNTAGRALLAEAKLFHGDIDLVQPVAFALIGRAPHIAHELLLHAIASEQRTGYRYHTGARVIGVINLQFLTLSVPTLVDQAERVYDLSLGYALVKHSTLHYNLGCFAARLGRRAPALRHIKRALALDYETPQKIHDDPDLESLRGDPAFEALFSAIE